MSALDSTPYIVGRFYPVKQVLGYVGGQGGAPTWWPVRGEAHTDTEIIHFPKLHFHIDWRFAGHALFKRVFDRNGRDPNLEQTALVLMLRDRHVFLARDNIETRVTRLRCKRETHTFPNPSAAGWIGDLRRHYAGACLKRGICPHRGYDLSSEPVIDGVVTCPLHGLRFNAETGIALGANA